MTKLYARLLLGVTVSDAVPSEAVGELTIPLLLIHGDADSQIPIEHSRQIHAKADPATTDLWIVAGADHGFAHALEGYRYENRVKQFFERNLCNSAFPQSGKEKA